jgi:hypothetical protein
MDIADCKTDAVGCGDLAAEEVEYCDLASSKEQIADLARRIGKLEQKPATADPNPSISERPKENLLKRHSYLVPLVTLLLGSGLLAFFKNGLIDGRIRETLRDPLQKIADQGEKIAEINGKLSGIADLLKIVVQNEMKRVSALIPLDFDKSLPDVKTLLSVARDEQVTSPNATVASIKSKLNTSEQGAPGFWPAAAAFVNYQSMRPLATPGDCLIARPVGRGAQPQPDPKDPSKLNFHHGPLVYSDCRIELDDPRAGVLLYAESLTISDVEFRHCIIAYKGRPIVMPRLPFPEDKLRGKMVFLNCMYEIYPPENPPKIGKILITALLKSEDPGSVVFAPPES